MTPITEAKAEEIKELRHTFSDTTATFDNDGAGGARIPPPLRLAPAYEQQTSWIAFQVTFPYPEADIYPPLSTRAFVRPDLRRQDVEAFHSFGGRICPERSCYDAVAGSIPPSAGCDEGPEGTRMAQRTVSDTWPS